MCLARGPMETVVTLVIGGYRHRYRAADADSRTPDGLN